MIPKLASSSSPQPRTNCLQALLRSRVHQAGARCHRYERRNHPVARNRQPDPLVFPQHSLSSASNLLFIASRERSPHGAWSLRRVLRSCRSQPRSQLRKTNPRYASIAKDIRSSPRAEPRDDHGKDALPPGPDHNARIRGKVDFSDRSACNRWHRPDRRIPGRPALGNEAALAASGNEGDTGLTLFGALSKQLGLKLESSKMPVDVLVVDSALKIPLVN